MAMPSKPKINSKSCTKCGTYLTGASYYSTKSKFFPDGLLPICKMCLSEMVGFESWTSMDKFCQWADYPFDPAVWSKMSVELGAKAFDAYVKGYTSDSEYALLDWGQCYEEWGKLLKTGEYSEKIPEISSARMAQLEANWGKGYAKEDLVYMEKFLKEQCSAHNIITPTQMDAARTIAKLSVRISHKIEEGADIDKDIASYDKEMKIGGFTSENVRNMSDFESIGELIAYLEKRGWKNPYYDGAPKDVVDTTIANMQGYYRRIVMGESSLKDVVEQRITSLGLNQPGDLDLSDADLDRYENEGFNEIEMEKINADDEEREMIVDD